MNGKEQNPFYYPVSLNIYGKSCVVVGGGEVALRKIKALLQHKAKVIVVSPVFCAELEELARDGKVEARRKEYEPGDLKDAFLAIAATDDKQTNRAVAAEARRRRIIVNVVDAADLSDFILPAYLRRGDLTIAVATDGISPALARKIRIRLESEFGEEYASLVRLIKEVRAELKSRSVTVSPDDWQRALDLDLLVGMLKDGRREQAKKALMLKVGISGQA